MPLARIVASNPAAARYTARTLREAGYEVEIVPHGSPTNPSVELEFDVDADRMTSQPTTPYVPGQREFVLKPLWRKFSAKRKADEDVARAQQARRSYSPVQQERDESARVAAPAASQRSSERRGEQAAQEARDAALAAAQQQRRAAAEEARRTAEEARRAEELRAQRLREEQELARKRALEEEQRAERRQEQARQLELARKRELEEQQMILRKQEEERQRVEAVRRQQEADAARQAQVAQERESRLRQEAMLRQAEEQHRDEVMRQRREEELGRRAEAQRLLLEANKRREESLRDRVSEPVIAEQRVTGSVPTLKEYFALRMDRWRQVRAARQGMTRSNVTRIDGSGRSAWRQAWPITAGVAAACLIGWGIAAYHEATPQSAQTPPILSPGEYAPYPVAGSAVNAAAKRPAASHQTRPKPTAVRRADIAEDEVVVHHYYPSKGATAQNRAPQRAKKITDLQ